MSVKFSFTIIMFRNSVLIILVVCGIIYLYNWQPLAENLKEYWNFNCFHYSFNFPVIVGVAKENNGQTVFLLIIHCPEGCPRAFPAPWFGSFFTATKQVAPLEILSFMKGKLFFDTIIRKSSLNKKYFLCVIDHAPRRTNLLPMYIHSLQ